MSRLQNLRDEIDQIDEELHDLLMRRIQIGKEVADAKGSSSGANLRPGREAQILRRLVARNKGPLSLNSIFKIWREILSSNLNQQISIKAAVKASSRDYHDLARDYCGTASEIIEISSSEEVISMVEEGTAHIGILPALKDEKERNWWLRLVNQTGENRVNVVSITPIVTAKNRIHEAVVVAKQEPEESGDDSTIFAIDGNVDEHIGKVIDSGYEESWKLLIVKGYDRELAVSGDVRWLRLGSFANLIKSD